MILKTFRYRIYPTKKQVRRLNNTLKICRWLYNHLLTLQKESISKNNTIIKTYDLNNIIKLLKEKFPTIKNVYSQTLQNIAFRVTGAIYKYFKLRHKNKKLHFPRFKSTNAYDSITFPQYPGGCKIKEKSFISVTNIGDIKLIYHRDINGKVKTCSIKRLKTGKWFITFVCEITESPQANKGKAIGVDLGLLNLATLSDGTVINNPKYFYGLKKKINKTVKRIKKDKRNDKYRKLFYKINEKITNCRLDFLHKQSRKLVDKYDLIVFESMLISSLIEKNINIRRALLDSSWKNFTILTNYKAECAGKKVIFVNPFNTSKTCSKCGNIEEIDLSQRTFVCSRCDLILDRDHNSAINILTLGLHRQESLNSKMSNAS